MEHAGQNQPKTLMHACCGPCSLEPCRILALRGHAISIFYSNPNIDPGEEYDRRLATLKAWAASQSYEVVEGMRDHSLWKDAVTCAMAAHPGEREERCRACYRLRLTETARYAAEHGFACIATTLSVSPYQYTDVIRQELERAAGLAGVTACFDDFRPFYEEATRRSRELGMYRQNYCGCEISREEARREREERKAEREARREAERAAHAPEREAQEQERLRNRREKQEYAGKRARQREILRQMRGL